MTILGRQIIIQKKTLPSLGYKCSPMLRSNNAQIQATVHPSGSTRYGLMDADEVHLGLITLCAHFVSSLDTLSTAAMCIFGPMV